MIVAPANPAPRPGRQESHPHPLPKSGGRWGNREVDQAATERSSVVRLPITCKTRGTVVMPPRTASAIPAALRESRLRRPAINKPMPTPKAIRVPAIRPISAVLSFVSIISPHTFGPRKISGGTPVGCRKEERRFQGNRAPRIRNSPRCAQPASRCADTGRLASRSLCANRARWIPVSGGKRERPRDRTGVLTI